MKKYIVAFMLLAILLGGICSGCASSGVPAGQYEQIQTRLNDAQAQVAGLQSENRELEAQNNSISAELEAVRAQIATAGTEIASARTEIAALQNETGLLREESDLAGATPAETAEKIVKKYSETHVYSVDDFFVCSNMALDVWNMLQAQGINAVIRIGDVETGVGDVADANHAWVLAEVSPGQYLALETTGGYVVPEGENPLYYSGWTFESPKEYRMYEELRREWNVRVDIIDRMTDIFRVTEQEYSEEYDSYMGLVAEFNEKYAGRPPSAEAESLQADIEAQLALAKEKEGRLNQLDELLREQEAAMENIRLAMSSLTG